MGVLNKIYKTSKGAIKGIMDEFKETGDLEKAINSLDKQIENSIENNVYNKVTISNNVEGHKEEISVFSNEDEVSQRVRERIEYTNIYEEYKDKIEEQELTDAENNLVLSEAISTMNAISYNGHTINRFKSIFLKNLATIYFNQISDKLIKNQVFKNADDATKFLSYVKRNYIVSNKLSSLASIWFTKNILSHYS